MAKKRIRRSIAEHLAMFHDPASCWIWTGAVNSHGYGRMQREKRRLFVHRAAWEAAHGPIPDGLHVLHKCDTPRCFNPSHLFLGTQSDNVADMAHKGRARGRFDYGQQNHVRLTEQQVREIRATPGRLVDIARRFHVTPENIARILKRETWKHLT